MTSEPTLTVAAVARRLGIAPSTLRTWDRRYGLGPVPPSVGLLGSPTTAADRITPAALGTATP